MPPAFDNIWDSAIAWDKQRRSDPNNSTTNHETTLLVVGNKGVGKSTLIHRLLEREEAAKPTLALEYTFGRKTNLNLSKDVCHIWELGGGTLFTKLLETPLSASKLETLHVVLTLDLSQPGQLWFHLEALMGALNTHLQHALKSPQAKEMDLDASLKKLLAARSDAEHPDVARMEPCAFPLIILGGRYDVFQDFDPEKKKIICRALRLFAHHHGATLQFYSAKDSGSVKKARDLLNHHAFGTELGQGMSQDYNKPIIIPAWSDSYAAIVGEDQGSTTLDMMKHHYTTHFPQSVDEHSALPEDPAKDPNFREPQVDQLRAQKDEDLERYRKDMERRSKQRWDEYFDQSQKY